MKIIDRISLYYKITNRFRPYFNNKEKVIEYFDIATIDLDPEIVSLYNETVLLGPKKYKKDKLKFRNYIEKINKHNENVNFVYNVVADFNYDVILLNPEDVSNKDRETFAKARDILKNYKILPDLCKKFINLVGPVIDDHDGLCFEHKIFLEYSNALDFSKYQYINEYNKRKILSDVNDILKKLNKREKLYYSYKKYELFNEEISHHNDVYLKNIVDDNLFDNINNHSLDQEQRKSILTDEKSVLVIAGAGSGKTLTICGKVTYLLNKKKEKPENILLLSYSKDSSNDLQGKLSSINPNITVGTFHKIGLDILKVTQNKIFMVEEQYDAIIEGYFRDEIQKNPKMLQAVLTFYALYLKGNKYGKKYDSEGSLYEDLKKFDFYTLKNQLLSYTNDINAKTTVKREHVKSLEEMAIANWYFINGIEYIYEAPYEFDVSTPNRRQYIPDFKLKNYPIYHEHYGVDKNGRAKQYKDEQEKKYLCEMSWKKQIHKTKKTDCIETFSYEFNDGTIFEKLEKELKKRGVVFNPLSNQEIQNSLNSIYKNRAFGSFIKLISTFLNLYKSTHPNDLGFEELRNINSLNKYEDTRVSLFLDISKDIYHYYINYLHQEGKIDFDDMILQSIDQLDNTKMFRYKYIIVDEFQDISFSRMKLLKKLIEVGQSKLFAVGDDWQAIYRFSGCDLNIFLNFSKYFGDSATTKLTTTYRSSQALQDIARSFIKKNPEQFDKIIRSEKHLEYPIRIMWYTGKKYHAFIDTLKYISKISPDASVLILGRNNKDFEDISFHNNVYIDSKASNEAKRIIKCNVIRQNIWPSIIQIN